MPRRGYATAAGWLLLAVTVAVCSAQTLPPAISGAAKVISVTGQVSVLRDSVQWALTEGSWIQPQQLIITGPDSYAVFQVSDGSTFEVYQNSRVTFRAAPGNWKDLLDLWIGRVKVHIQKLGGDQPNPNRVHTPTAVISVRGTVFHVATEDDCDTTFVQVDEGQVEVRHRLIPREKPELVNAGEYLRVYKNQPLSKGAMDKNALIQRLHQVLSDALYTILYRTQGVSTRIPTGGSGGTVTLPGDTDTGSKVPPAPPAPPAP
jgi:hypothetical protein